MVSAGDEPDLRMEGELALAGAELDLDGAQRQAERNHLAANGLEDGLDLVEARLGQILVALRDQADLGRRARPGGVVRAQAGIVELEHVELDLEARHVIEPGLGQLVQRAAIEMAGGERHLPAVLEIDVAQHPAGLRRPGQHAEGGGIGDHEEVAGALHLRHAEAAPGREDREHRLVGVSFAEQRGGDRAAVAHDMRSFVRHHRLAAQDAMLIGKRQADDLEPVLLDPFVGMGRRLELFVVPQPLALDEAARRSFLR